MTLTQQFLIVSLLPISFLGMTVYLWRSGLKRPKLMRRWSFAMIAAAVWGSSVLRLYGGSAFPPVVIFNWGIIGRYALSLTALGILLTTITHLSIPRTHSILTLTVSALLLIAALGLDPLIWPHPFTHLVLADQRFRLFDLWAAVWIASWLVPAMASWMLAQQISGNIPSSLYRNQIHYWMLVLGLFLLGAALASVQQSREPAWQEAGLLIIIPAALIGTISITHSQLPDLQLALRQILSRLSGTLIIFLATWLALFFINEGIAETREETTNLILVLAAAGFAVLFTLLYRLVNDVTRHIFLPTLARREIAMADYAKALGNLPDSVQLGQLFLRIVQSNLTTDEGWFFVTEEGPGGKLLLQPLASLTPRLPETAIFEGNSPFTVYLRENNSPLVQHDINALGAFDEMPAAEKAVLTKWKRVLFMPLHAGENLVGVLALGGKYTGEPYERNDIALLTSLADQVGPLLAQAQNLASLRQINDYVFHQNQALARDRQHLKELANLYTQFVDLISPDLRGPFASINKQLQRLQIETNENNKQQQLVEDLSKRINELKSPIDKLINISDRIQTRSHFDFELVQMDEVVRNAIRNLTKMAEARRVKVEFDPELPLPPVLGDENQLLEAIQHLLHNAIKFNKIGGVVKVKCSVSGSDVCVRIIDTGVGIPEERLEAIWSGFSTLKQGRNGRGTGLGLALTRFIVAAHSGRVDVESKYGSGSLFAIYLPLVFEDSVVAT